MTTLAAARQCRSRLDLLHSLVHDLREFDHLLRREEDVELVDAQNEEIRTRRALERSTAKEIVSKVGLVLVQMNA
ncbi:MAG: hypothetical protein ACK55Z_37595, partial [bacterium]